MAIKGILALPEGEEGIIDGFANKIGLWGRPGGRLILTNKRLLFTNRRKTIIRDEYPLSNIIAAFPASNATFWTTFLIITLFLRNAIKVTSKGEGSQRFVVNDRNRWISLINEYRKKPSG